MRNLGKDFIHLLLPSHILLLQVGLLLVSVINILCSLLVSMLKKTLKIKVLIAFRSPYLNTLKLLISKVRTNSRKLGKLDAYNYYHYHRMYNTVLNKLLIRILCFRIGYSATKVTPNNHVS